MPAGHDATGRGRRSLTAARRARLDIREGRHPGPTRGMAPGYVQANLAIVDRWACGVTPQEAALASGLPLVIAHAPGHGFITDLELDRVAAR